MNRIYSLIVLSLLFVYSGCQNNLTDPNEKDSPVIATGTFQDINIDKSKYGDFQFVLELEKLNFNYEESINIKVYFKNMGLKTITLNGILPFRNSANPPRIVIWAIDNSLRFQINEILQNLLNEDDIVVDIGKSVMLMNFDLTKVGGFQLEKDEFDVGYSATELENVYSSFSKGTYNIFADYWPTPVPYTTNTDTLTFTIN